jgi:hypothetical protein
MKKLINYLRPSLETNGTASARKLSSFMTMGLIIIVHIWWLRHAYQTSDFIYLGEILIIDYSAMGVFLGLKTWESIKLNKGSSESEKTD